MSAGPPVRPTSNTSATGIDHGNEVVLMAGVLFSPDELKAYLQISSVDGDAGTDQLTSATVTAIEKVVRGQILDAAGLAEFPAQLPEAVSSWALELAAIAYANPTAAAQDGTDNVTAAYTERRREAILARAQAWGAKVAPLVASVSGPRWSFPPAAYPNAFDRSSRRDA